MSKRKINVQKESETLSIKGYADCPMIRACILHMLYLTKDDRGKIVDACFDQTDIGLKYLKKIDLVWRKDIATLHKYWNYDTALMASIGSTDPRMLKIWYIISMYYDDSPELCKYLDARINEILEENYKLTKSEGYIPYLQWQGFRKYSVLIDIYNLWIQYKSEPLLSNPEYAAEQRKTKEETYTERYLFKDKADGEYMLSPEYGLKVFDYYKADNKMTEIKALYCLLEVYFNTLDAADIKKSKNITHKIIISNDGREFLMEEMNPRITIKNTDMTSDDVADIIDTLFSITRNTPIKNRIDRQNSMLSTSYEINLMQEILFRMNYSRLNILNDIKSLIYEVEGDSLKRLSVRAFENDEKEKKRLLEEINDLKRQLTSTQEENQNLRNAIIHTDIDNLVAQNEFLVEENASYQEILGKSNVRVSKLENKVKKLSNLVSSETYKTLLSDIDTEEQENTSNLDSALLKISEFCESTGRRVVVIGGIEKWRVNITQEIEDYGIFEKGKFIFIDCCPASINTLTSDDFVICQTIGVKHCDTDYLSRRRSALNFDFIYLSSINFEKVIDIISKALYGDISIYK